MAKKSNTKIGDNKEKDDLSLTMQQKFNFDSNELDEEDTKTYKLKRKQNVVRSKREKELIKLKNKYKKKFAISLVTSVILFFFCVISVLAYIFVKPKEIEVEKVVNMTDENIVFLGDSITERYDLDDYYKNVHQVNSGFSGHRTDDILDNMYERVYRYNPTKVFLLIGTNDIQMEETNDYIYENIIEIVKEIKKERPHTKIYVESLYPINNSDDEKIDKKMVGIRSNEDINEINDRLKKYCNKYGFTYIDINTKLRNKDGLLELDYTKDGLHLNDEGYKKVTSILNKYIKE